MSENPNEGINDATGPSILVFLATCHSSYKCKKRSDTTSSQLIDQLWCCSESPSLIVVMPVAISTCKASIRLS